LNENKIRVVHITSVHRRHDTRILTKECASLAKHGFEVSLITADGEGDAKVGSVEILDVGRSRGRVSRITFSAGRVLKRALEINAGVYHIHDPELLPAGIIIGLYKRRPVIYDLHEDVPVQILNKTWIGSVLMRRVVARLFDLFQRFAFVFMSALVAATPDIESTLPSRKAVLIRNFPWKARTDESDGEAKSTRWQRTGPVVIYTGSLSEVRGIRELVRAIECVQCNAVLWLLGPWESEEYEEECRSLPGWKRTEYLGFVKPDQVFEYLRLAAVGAVTLMARPNYLTSLPVKAFEFMASGLPMVMSNFPFWMQMFGRCALFADPSDPSEIARAVDLLLSDRALGRRLGEAGKGMIAKEYNWESESEKLILLYEKLLER
jgi:glycosyltransferase involved in cell wall biosynthesis